MLGIIGAMDLEIEPLKSALKDPQAHQIGYTRYFTGELKGVPVCLARCGIGKVHAALCALGMILRFPVDAVLNIGVAGALRDTLGIADLVIADSAVQHDMDTTPIGDPLGLISGPNIVYMPCDGDLSALLVRAAQDTGLRAERAAVATGDQFIATLEKKDFLADTFGAAACDMEGGAIAQCCFEMNVSYAAVRAISDTRLGDGREYAEKAGEACRAEARLLRRFLELYAANKEENSRG